MATQTIEFIAAGGLSLSAKLFAINSDTVLQTASSVSEATNRKSVYNAVFTDVPAGTYQLIAFSGANSVALWEVDLTLATATFRAYDPLNPKSIRAALGMTTNNLDAQLTQIQNDIQASSSPILFPVFNKTPDRISDSNIKLFFQEEIDVNLVLTDENNELIDVTSKTLKVVIEDALGNDVDMIANGDLIKSVGNVAFTVGTVVTENVGVYKYALRDITNKNIVLAYGNIDVQYLPEVDSGQNENIYGALPDDNLLVYSNAADRNTGNNFFAYYIEEVDLTIKNIVDSDGIAIDLNSRTLKIIIEDATGDDILTILDVDITKDVGFATFTITDVVTGNVGNYVYSLRDTTAGKNTVLAYGNIGVQYAPENGAYL